MKEVITERRQIAPGGPGAARLTIIVALGIAVVLAAFYSPWFSDPQGELSGRFALATGTAAGLVTAGYAASLGLWSTAFWVFLAFVGSASALQLVEAGHHVRYQHYMAPGSIPSEAHPLVLAIVAFQVAAVAAGSLKHLRGFKDWLLERFRPWQVLAVALVVAATSATVSRDKTFYIQEVMLASFIQAISMANILLVARSLPRDAPGGLGRVIKGLFADAPPRGERPGKGGGLDAFVLSVAAWVVVASALLAYAAYDLHPHVSDEVTNLFLARNMAEGQLTMELPPVLEAFDVDLMYYDAERWFSPVPPGWSAALAVGVRLGVPWLVNPLLGGLCVLLAYLLVSNLYDRRTARISASLLAVSPWFLFLSMSYMNHHFPLACGLAAALCVAHAVKDGRPLLALAGGAAAGLVGLTRPLDGLAVMAMLGVCTLWATGWLARLYTSLAFALGAVAVNALILPYNKHLMGSATRFPLMAYFDKYFGPGKNNLGFGPGIGVGWEFDPYPGHGLMDVIVNSNLNITATNVELFGWATGSFVLMAVMLLSRSMKRADYLAGAFIAVIIFIYSFYYFSGGPDFGARYWFLIIAPSVILTARGIVLIADRQGPGGRTGPGDWRVLPAVTVLAVMALTVFMPWRVGDKYKNYLGMRPDVLTLAEENSFGGSLVLIRGERFPDYGSAAIYNPLDLTGEGVPIYAWARDPVVAERAARAYPDRPVWLVDGPTVTGAGFEVAAGPLTQGELSALLAKEARKVVN